MCKRIFGPVPDCWGQFSKSWGRVWLVWRYQSGRPDCSLLPWTPELVWDRQLGEDCRCRRRHNRDHDGWLAVQHSVGAKVLPRGPSLQRLPFNYRGHGLSSRVNQVKKYSDGLAQTRIESLLICSIGWTQSAYWLTCTRCWSWGLWGHSCTDQASKKRESLQFLTPVSTFQTAIVQVPFLSNS